MTEQALSVADLERILDERKARLQELAKQRDDLQKTVETLDAEIQDLIGAGGTFRRVRRRRVKNETPLRPVVLKILKTNKKGFTLGDLALEVKNTGYKSHSRNFRNVLYQCLYNTPEIKHIDATGCYVIA